MAIPVYCRSLNLNWRVYCLILYLDVPHVPFHVQPSNLSRCHLLIWHTQLFNFISAGYEWCAYSVGGRCSHGAFQLLQYINDWTSRDGVILFLLCVGPHISLLPSLLRLLCSFIWGCPLCTMSRRIPFL